MGATLNSTPITLPAAADYTLTPMRFGKIVAGQAAICTVAGERADGVLGAHQKKNPVAGDAIDFYFDRLMLIEANGAIGSGVDITTDANGKAKAAAAGDVVNGTSIDAAAADKQYIRFLRPSSKSAAAQNVADGNVAPGSLVIHQFKIADAATADYDLLITDKIEVLDVLVQKQAANGGAANTVQVKNAGNAITDAVSININDQALARAAAVNDANSVIAAGGTLRASVIKAGGNAACFVTVIGIKRA